MTHEGLELTVGESMGGIEAGDIVTATVTGSEVKSFEYDGDEVTYWQLSLEENETGMNFSPDWPAALTENTGLGQLMQRFGVDLTIGNGLNPAEIIEVGQEVDFLVSEEEGDEGTFLVADEASVSPAGDLDGDSVQNDESGSGDDESDDESDDEMKNTVLDIVEDHEGEEEGEVKKAVISESNELLPVYKDLVESESIEVVDGSVMLA